VELEELAVVGAAAASLAATSGVLAWVFYTRFFVRVPPNRALVIYGGSGGSDHAGDPSSRSSAEIRPPRILVGGRAFVAPWNRSTAYLSLSPIEVDLTVRSTHSREGGGTAGWAVELGLQAKVPADGALLAAAAENLLGRGDEEVRTILRQTAEGAIPAILARIDPDGAEPDWEQLGAEIQAAIAADLVPLGLVVQNLAVKQLSRISGARGPGPGSSGGSDGPRTARLEPVDTDPTPPGYDVRVAVARLERSVGVLGAQVDRIAQEGSPAPRERESDSAFEASLGFGRRGRAAPGPSRPGSSQDSTGDDRPSRSRPTAPDGPAGEGRRTVRPPLNVDEEG
jgi:hypothetical protein